VKGYKLFHFFKNSVLKHWGIGRESERVCNFPLHRSLTNTVCGQPHGRGIRTETDTACCAILDIRAGKRGAYRRHTLSALPKSEVTSSIEAVRNFFLEKKPAAYFLPKNQA